MFVVCLSACLSLFVCPCLSPFVCVCLCSPFVNPCQYSRSSKYGSPNVRERFYGLGRYADSDQVQLTMACQAFLELSEVLGIANLYPTPLPGPGEPREPRELLSRPPWTPGSPCPGTGVGYNFAVPRSMRVHRCTSVLSMWKVCLPPTCRFQAQRRTGGGEGLG